MILLKGQEDTCVLSASSKTLINTWLNSLCKSCGFNEQSASSSHSNISKQISSNSTGSTKKLKETTKNQLIRSYLFKPPVNTVSKDKKKPIAGVAALSVGSIDLISNPKLDTLFKRDNQTSSAYLNDENLQHIFNLIYSNSNVDEPNESYLNLDECLSGQEELLLSKITKSAPNGTKLLLEPPFKLTSSYSSSSPATNSTASPSTSTTSSNKSSLFDLNNKLNKSSGVKPSRVVSADQRFSQDYQNSEFMDQQIEDEILNEKQDWVNIYFILSFELKTFFLH